MSPIEYVVGTYDGWQFNSFHIIEGRKIKITYLINTNNSMQLINYARFGAIQMSIEKYLGVFGLYFFFFSN